MFEGFCDLCLFVRVCVLLLCRAVSVCAAQVYLDGVEPGRAAFKLSRGTAHHGWWAGPPARILKAEGGVQRCTAGWLGVRLGPAA